jgi:hypothetical protein
MIIVLTVGKTFQVLVFCLYFFESQAFYMLLTNKQKLFSKFKKSVRIAN